VDAAQEMDSQHRRQRLQRKLGERRPAADSGIVDDDVDTPELVGGVLDELPATVRCGHIRGGRDRAAAERADLAGGSLRYLRLLAGSAWSGGAHIVDHDRRAPSGQLESMRSPDAAAATGDDGDVPGEVHHFSSHRLPPTERAC
jgi:hypothetical protein